jgi:hypothetical protein
MNPNSTIMNKILLSFVLMLFGMSTLFAQRDTEHWIAPYYASTTGYTNALYLSTDSTTPFDVKIYNNNTLLTTVTISKGNPQSYTVSANLISATTASEALQIITKGFI